MEPKELDRLITCAELRNPNQFNASRERYLAEISFKAGMEEEAKGGLNSLSHITGFREGKVAGIREVVEWMLTQQLPKEYQAEEYRGLIVVDNKHWQAKLKEWGIKEG